jgi:hypothetical protein
VQDAKARETEIGRCYGMEEAMDLSHERISDNEGKWMCKLWLASYVSAKSVVVEKHCTK